MMKFEVLCRECGVVHPDVRRKGEICEPTPREKAEIVAELHEEDGDDCEAYVLLKNERKRQESTNRH